MTFHTLIRDGAELFGNDTGAGLPVVFQHGLGGDEAQVAEVFPDTVFRRLTLECRGQGRSPLGPAGLLSIATFADDVLAFANARGVQRFVAGGISMGAAIALRLAVIAPERVQGLVLIRPAWLWGAAPDNMRPYAEVANLLDRLSPTEALANFDASATGAYIESESPDNYGSLRKFFRRRDALTTATLLSAIAGDGPGVTEAQVRAITVPTLVAGSGIDVAHPLAMARTLAETIPGARFFKVPPKSNSRKRHADDARALMADFLAGLRMEGEGV